MFVVRDGDFDDGRQILVDQAHELFELCAGGQHDEVVLGVAVQDGKGTGDVEEVRQLVEEGVVRDVNRELEAAYGAVVGNLDGEVGHGGGLEDLGFWGDVLVGSRR